MKTNVLLFIRKNFNRRIRMLDTIIKNGTVVNADSSLKVDVGIKNGEIVQIGHSDYFPEARINIDASGMEVYPGMIDSHVHINLKLGEFTTLDSFSQASKAAAFGGTTTLIEFAIPYEGETPIDALVRRMSEANEESYVNYSFHGCFTDSNLNQLGQVKELIQSGIPSIKMFTVYDNSVRINKGGIYDILKKISQYDGLALFHAENNDIINRAINNYVNNNQLSPIYHAKSRPPIAEAEEVASLLALLEETEAPGLFVHMSTGKVREILQHYKQVKKLPIFTEVCTHYLSLEEDIYNEDKGHLYICSPPIRANAEKDMLWEMVSENLIDVVNSDHCCYDSLQKDKYSDYFPSAPNGLPGIETRGIVLYSDGVQTRRLTREKFAALTSTNVARTMGMYPRKGRIGVGSDADIAIVDPTSTQRITADNLHMQTDYTPFEGKLLKGKVAHTLVAGHQVIADGQLSSETRFGSFVKRSKPMM
ncbi:dihydropyrimidinase [Peribacillus cavernae]|uniref:Dihydropyrimidinase n=1 Tax=Peribacillus cavernae TaxID=1674310 RepID=A0A3S1B248_9BACI|nr:dihydropyrimidinase [Peribacillus cavernae]MDQ0221191.1 dihydropyrimidinase [Peribacillus cavernae]RUQ26930.1 dihydropyrimidinase [Peribacillus cavernae]